MDVKKAFLHGKLKEELYMRPPEGFEDRRGRNLVCKLEMSLYGLKQSPRQWNRRFDSFITGIGFERSQYDTCVYFSSSKSNDIIIFVIYVNDLFIASRCKDEIKRLKSNLSSEFEMKDLGLAQRILGMAITRDRKKGVLKID